MRLTILSLFISAIATNAFVTPQTARQPTLLKEINSVDDFAAEVVDKTETILGKADDLILNRVMRAVNHAPAIVTLKALGEAAGSSKYGIDAAASALSVSAPALLSVPAWTGNALRLVCVAQLASIAKSVLASDSDELSQGDIASTTAANWVAAKAISGGGLKWMALTAVVSGHSARNGADGDFTIHTAAMQILSSFSAVATILGAANAAPSIIPVLAGQTELVAGLGLAGYYIGATRSGNGTTKKVVNAAIIGGMLWSKIAGGALALTMGNLLQVGTLVTAGTAYVAYNAITSAKDALA